MGMDIEFIKSWKYALLFYTVHLLLENNFKMYTNTVVTQRSNFIVTFLLQ